MSVLIIPDIHGTSSWQSIFRTDSWKIHELVIFLGDFCDSYDKTDACIIQNLDFVMKLKDECKDKVVLLMGNHDIQYYSTDSRFKCTGYRRSYSEVLKRIFEINVDKFQLAKSFNINGSSYLCTHAGVSNGWLETCGMFGKPEVSIETFINNAWYSEDWDYVSMISSIRGGLDDFGGPLWADMDEFHKGSLNVPGNFNQIVGHTHRRFGVCEFNEVTSAFILCIDNLVAREFNNPFIAQICDDGRIVNANLPDSNDGIPIEILKLNALIGQDEK